MDICAMTCHGPTWPMYMPWAYINANVLATGSDSALESIRDVFNAPVVVRMSDGVSGKT